MNTETQMTAEQAKEVFNNVIATMTDADEISKVELIREYFTNPEFRKWLEEYSFNATIK